MSETLLAWHWLREDRMLAHTPGRTRPVEVGETLSVPPPLFLCEHGLHASERAIDSLDYAPGPIVCRVELSGEVLRDSDKLCAERRIVLAMADATQTLGLWSCSVAEQALLAERAAGREPAARSFAAIEIKRRWLRGEASDSELSAAESAAESAARSAAWSAAWSAAESAAESAAWSAAWSAAESAAWSAARSAAWSAFDAELERMLLELLGLTAPAALVGASR